jgi:hypothetical protein
MPTSPRHTASDSGLIRSCNFEGNMVSNAADSFAAH